MEGLAQATEGCWAALGTGVLWAKACSIWTPCSQTIAGEDLSIALIVQGVKQGG